MRILWFVNAPLPEMIKKYPEFSITTGWWLIEGAKRLANENVELFVAYRDKSSNHIDEFRVANINYIIYPEILDSKLYNINKWILKIYNKISKSFSHIIAPTNATKNDLKVISLVKPDLIHVHGTERNYGLVTSFLPSPIPTLITIQGLMTPVAQNYWGTLPAEKQNIFTDLKRSFQNAQKSAIVEQKIFKSNKFFSGRTEWDQAWCNAMNPKCKYFSDYAHIVRPEFFNTHWQIENVRKFSIYSTVTIRPYKGIEVLLTGLKYILQFFPNTHLRLAGDINNKGYGSFLHSLINDMRLADNVSLLGYLSPEKIASELKAAHVFVLPSMIENSSLSLSESQIVGVPAVASYTGGVPSMISDGKTGLLFQKGDSAMLAANVIKIFNDNNLASSLSENVRKEALEKHNPDVIIRRLMEIYQQVIASQ